MTTSLAGRRALRRYSRHLLIPEVGLSGQAKLMNARVLCVGAGGLGSPVLQYLAAAGVGRIGVVDDDVVDETNLQRQVIFTTADIGRRKAVVAAERIAALNPQVAVDSVGVRFDASNARELIRLYDVIVDATDTFGTRYLINDAAHFECKPVVHGSIFRFDGQVTVFDRAGPCYRCLFAEPPPAGSVPSCAEGGVLGVLAGVVGTWQANEALKLILGIGRPLIGRLLVIDALDARTREFTLARDPACILCGDVPTIDAVVESAQPQSSALSGVSALGVGELDEFLARDVGAQLLDVREPHEIILGVHPRAIHIPASQLEERLSELDTARTYVVACRIGAKSRWAAQRLHDAGFRKLAHLEGGLLAYAVREPHFEMF